MHESLNRQSALAEQLGGVGGTRAEQQAGVTITERRSLQIAEVAFFAPPSASEKRALAEASGTYFPEQPGSTSTLNKGSLLCLGHDRWLVVTQGTLAMGFLNDLLRGTAAISDLSHARSVLRLSGGPARDWLARKVAIDLHERAFPPGSCAQTAIEEINVLVHFVDATPNYDLYVDRSSAVAFWDLLKASRMA